MASSQLEKAKEQVKKYEGTIANANKIIATAKATVANLSKEYAGNEKQIEKVKNQTEKYDSLISKTTTQAANYRKNLEDNKIKLGELEAAQKASKKALEEAQNAENKVSLKKLSKEYEKNTKAVEKAKSVVEKYSQSSKALEQQAESYAKKLAVAKSKLQTLEKAQETNTKAVETARKVIVDYEKVISKNNEQLSKAKAEMREYSKVVVDNNKKIAEAKKTVQKWGKSVEKTMDTIVKRAAQTTLAVASIISGFAVKEGFGEAMNLEGYKMQLETATKSTEKAGQLMSKAIKFANSTPFETGEVVEATAKMEAYGISSERWLKDVADMAGATNKSIDQATEAMADAVMGEWTRLKEFGIKKEELIEAAAKKYGKDIVFNKKGQVKDQIKLEETLQKVMQEKFEGGAEKQAKTLKGLWSTVTGVTKSSLAKIVGITEQGTIKQGSLYEKLKQQVEKIVDILNRWQEDGTIDKIAEKVTKAVESMIVFFGNLFEFIKDHRALIETILVFVSSIYLVVKALIVLKSIITVISIVVGLLNGTLASIPLVWIVLAIAGVVAVCYVLWQHLDAVINAFKSLFSWIKNLLDGIGDFAFLLGGPIAPLLGLIQHFDKLKEVGEKAWGVIKKIFGAKDTDISITENKVAKDKIETIQTLKVNNPVGIGGVKIPELTVPKKSETNFFNQDEKQSQTAVSAKEKIPPNVTVILEGDFYGFKDFKSKVAEAVVKIANPNISNMV
ncbi:hypothetical protein [Cetobacterium sp.]